MFDTIFNNFNVYFNSLDKNNIQFTTSATLLDKTFKVTNSNKLHEKLTSLLHKIDMNFKMPVVYVHGDLTFKNILLENSEYYFIDWEFAGIYTFTHDIMHMFSKTIDIKQDPQFMENYFIGKYDNQFSKLFNSFGYKFNNSKKAKLYYIALYLMERIVYFEKAIMGKSVERIVPQYIGKINEVVNIANEING